MEILVSGILSRSGRILDVGCGTGATTRYVSRYWRPEFVLGINISQRQISYGQKKSVGCSFAVMDAAAIALADHSFEAIISVEAAFHFHTRWDFLKESARVLTKDGTLAMTDVLLHEDGHDLLPLWPRSNFIRHLCDYQSLVCDAGFSRVEVLDITEPGLNSFVRNKFAALHDDWLSGKSDFLTLQYALCTMYRLAAACKFNLICLAIK
jgi:ubiquinone/menaquinone biosynthesis C-methylase UbiE